ncbi:PBECR4 domain-containing protein [Avibacterium sp. 21-599]|uniref:PBECR4 domain-containing protein n=1 Tax=Avibacterium sp. 21-599 TaxID=2911528 RepID=UPI002245E276|nr:PBECR4 domain-containing protein [Avibacterium sp. 21-599]MCW9718089.1 PBECR4 domain-containing protein [Avibacterium sp. 21-599]
MTEQEKLKRYINDIENAAIFVEKHFINKEVIYSTNTENISIIFKRSNFMHLCGIKYNDGANEFFNAATNHKLDLKKIKVKKDGITFLKLSLLKSIEYLLSSEIILTDNAIYLHIAFDKALKTKKQIFSLTLKSNNAFFVPQSLLNLKQMNNFPNGKNYRDKIYCSAKSKRNHLFITINKRMIFSYICFIKVTYCFYKYNEQNN